MRDPAGGRLRLECVGCEARCSSGGDTDADGLGAVFEVGEALEPEPPSDTKPARDRVGAESTATATAAPRARQQPRREGPARSRRPGRARDASSASAVDAILASLGGASRRRPAGWYDACRSCPGGRLVATRDDPGGRLVLGCEACVSGCSSPGDAAPDGFGALVAFADALGVQATQRLERA
jgi:hypothetical protein